MTRTTSETTDPRLLLKATPPKVPKSLLTRARLSIDGPELADKAVIAVHAAAGFGKTALLAQWRRERLETGDVVAWLTLDNWDDDNRFCQSLAVAMQVASGRLRFGQSYQTAGNQHHEGLTGWLAEVVEMASEIVLILDEAHTIPAATTRNSLVYLLHNAPANLRIVLASRRPLQLPVSDLLAHGQFGSVDADALRLRPQETVSLLTTRFGARIDVDTCIRLHEITEGWPLGLQLALAAIEKSQNLRDAIDGCLSCSGDIRRYFVESLVERLPSAMTGFLVRVSFIDALHPALCQAITEREDSAQVLSRLCELTPIFAESMDSDWLRIHLLAREFLNERFDALPALEQRTLRARAAQWLAGQRMFEEAGRHALLAGQEELAYELAERCLYDVVRTGQLSRVAEWIGHIPATEIERRPRLRVAVAWTLAQSDRHVEAARMVGPIIDDPAADAGERCESAEICATAALFADDIDALEHLVSPWFDTLSSRSAVQRSVGTNHMALLALLRGSPEMARYHLQHLPREGDWGGGYARGWGDWVVGMSYLWEGQVELGEEHLRAALARAEEKCGRRGPIAVMLAASLAAVLWERNRHGEIAALLANRLDVLERHAPPDAIVLGYLATARAATAEGREGHAYDVLEHLVALGDARHLPRLCIASIAEQIRMHALCARADACAALAARLETLCARDWGLLQPLIDIQSGLAHARLSLVDQDWQEALVRLEAIHRLAERLRRRRDLIQIQLLKSLAQQKIGDEFQALFAEAIGMAQSLGLVRILADTHPDLQGWITPQRRTIGTASGRPGEQSAVTAVRVDHAPPARVIPSALLTPKEREILGLLANNMSNKQIALALDVGAETVKWHLKNLFGKLYAANRKHLLDRARMLGILDPAA